MLYLRRGFLSPPSNVTARCESNLRKSAMPFAIAEVTAVVSNARAILASCDPMHLLKLRVGLFCHKREIGKLQVNVGRSHFDDKPCCWI